MNIDVVGILDNYYIYRFHRQEKSIHHSNLGRDRFALFSNSAYPTCNHLIDIPWIANSIQYLICRIYSTIQSIYSIKSFFFNLTKSNIDETKAKDMVAAHWSMTRCFVFALLTLLKNDVFKMYSWTLRAHQE